MGKIMKNCQEQEKKNKAALTGKKIPQTCCNKINIVSVEEQFIEIKQSIYTYA